MPRRAAVLSLHVAEYSSSVSGLICLCIMNPSNWQNHSLALSCDDYGDHRHWMGIDTRAIVVETIPGLGEAKHKNVLLQDPYTASGSLTNDPPPEMIRLFGNYAVHYERKLAQKVCNTNQVVKRWSDR